MDTWRKKNAQQSVPWDMQIILLVIHQMKIWNLECFNPAVEKLKIKNITHLIHRMKTIQMSSFNYKEHL